MTQTPIEIHWLASREVIEFYYKQSEKMNQVQKFNFYGIWIMKCIIDFIFRSGPIFFVHFSLTHFYFILLRQGEATDNAVTEISCDISLANWIAVHISFFYIIWRKLRLTWIRVDFIWESFFEFLPNFLFIHFVVAVLRLLFYTLFFGNPAVQRLLVVVFFFSPFSIGEKFFVCCEICLGILISGSPFLS